MTKKQFKSESKRLLDLMINSIYTNKEIFLRELISNASDALDKLYYRSLTDKKIKIKKDELSIQIKINSKEKILTISDNGCGMTENELENNLGTIAKSGSLAFKELADKKNKIDIIGQFGVGFYSAFMVSNKIEVISKSIDSEKAYSWKSSGADGYSIEPSTRDTNGTTINLYLKDDIEEEKYHQYLDEYTIKKLIKKYSDYIRYPIKLNNSKTNDTEVLNSMIPIWKRNKKDISDEDYNNFYMDKFNDFERPLKVIHTSVEGLCSYKGLLFIPSKLPYDFYTKKFEKGLSIYSNGVLIMDKCPDLLPDYFSFIKGVIDTEDLSLNISREMLQKDQTLKLISKNIETKIKKELIDMLTNDRESYEKFFKSFGVQLKFGVYNNFGLDKEKLKDLIMFISSNTKKLITLKEYVDNMKDDQSSIYYACGETIDKIDNLPQVEQIKDKNYEILYLTDYVDEFVLAALGEYNGKKFTNVSDEKLDLESDESKDIVKKENDSNSEMLNYIKEQIDVSEVRYTGKLKNHPVCLTSKGEVSIGMEKVINNMPTDERIKADLILEININHSISKKIKDMFKNDKEGLKKYAKILYAEARLIEGLPIENPTELSNLICEVLSK